MQSLYCNFVSRFEGSIQPMEGVLSATRDSKTDPEAEEVAPYTFNCETKFKTKLPYSVTIYADEGRAIPKLYPLPQYHLYLQMLLPKYQSTTLQAMFLNPASTSVFYQSLHLKIPPSS